MEVELNLTAPLAYLIGVAVPEGRQVMQQVVQKVGQTVAWQIVPEQEAGWVVQQLLEGAGVVVLGALLQRVR